MGHARDRKLLEMGMEEEDKEDNEIKELERLRNMESEVQEDNSRTSEEQNAKSE